MHTILSNLLYPVFITEMFEIALVVVIVAIGILRAKKQTPIAKEMDSSLNNPQGYIPTPIKQIQQLESEKETLRHEPRKHKRKPYKVVVYTLLLFGAISLIASIIFMSSILAFIGLGLTFWGFIFFFIRATKLVKVNLLDSAAISSLATINQIIDDLEYKGKAIYLPPWYLKGLNSGTIFISSKKEIIIPPVKEIAKEKVFLKDPNGICLIPPGRSLANLFEIELGKDFAKVDLNYLQNNLPKLFIENLEIAEDLEINVEGDMIQVRIIKSIYENLCKEARKLQNICGYLGCPLCSSIAIALTRATGKPIVIQKANLYKDNKTIEVYYQLINE